MRPAIVPLALAWLAGPTGASAQGQGQAQGLEQRVTVLESSVGTLTQQVAAQGQQLTTLSEQIAAQGQQLGALSQQLAADAIRLTAVENATQPLIVDVDCSVGTINGTLGQAARHPELVIVRISGICHESVSVNRDNVRLVGARAGAGVEAPATLRAVSLTNDRHNIVISNLRLTGGLNVGFRTDVVVSNSIIEGSVLTGINVNGAILLSNTTVRNNTGAGINATTGSHVRVAGGLITNNGGAGIATAGGVAVQLTGFRADPTSPLVQASVTDNGQAGIQLVSSVLDSFDGIIDHNAHDGIRAFGGSSVNLSPTSSVQNNGANGVNLGDASVTTNFGDAHITNNGGWGVLCTGVAQISGPLGNISGNHVGQVNCPPVPRSF